MKHRKVMLFSAVIVIILIAVFSFELYISKYGLTCSMYQIESEKITSSFRIVQLTDLHNSEFGENNEKLVETVKEQSPDLILVTGDIVNSDEKDTTIAVNLIEQLSKICPVYISYGNHEDEYTINYSSDIGILYRDAGGIVLEKEYADICVNGQEIRIGGIYGNCLPLSYLETGDADAEECEFLVEFQDTTKYTILMCHVPVCWLNVENLSEWDVDCILSGHFHGGEVILPLVGGLYAPDMGWFPGRLQGLYYSEDGEKTLVLSRGLGTTEVIPRFNNIPEVVVVDIVPE